MPSTGIINGTLVKIQIGGVTVSHLTSNGFSFSHSVRGATSKDSAGWEDSLEGLQSWSMSCESMDAEDATYGFADLFAVGRGVVAVKSTSLVTGDEEYTGNAYIESLEKTNPLEESSTFTLTLKGTGPLTKATIS